MASIQKLKNKKFRVEIRKGEFYRSRTFPTKVQAMVWAAETEQSLSNDTIVRGKRLGDLLSTDNKIALISLSYVKNY